MNRSITLLADIGGTNARFALASIQGPTSIQTFQCDCYDTVELAIDAYLGSQGINEIHNLCFAVAGPNINGIIKVTNSNWVVNSKYLQQLYNLNDVCLLNDFESIAYSINHLTDNQLILLGGTQYAINEKVNFTCGIIGPGSGLGVSCLCKRDNNIFPIVSEAGHASFSPMTALQSEILCILKEDYQIVSNEHLLSGSGIINIYRSICCIENVESHFQTAANIGDEALKHRDSICAQSLNVFFEILGQVAGDITLIFGAFDGIYLAGGIVPRYQKLIKSSSFRSSFENKSQHRELLEKTPTWSISESYTGLLGANEYAKNIFT